MVLIGQEQILDFDSPIFLLMSKPISFEDQKNNVLRDIKYLKFTSQS